MTVDHENCYSFESNSTLCSISLVSAILRLLGPSDVQLKLVPETLALNPLDLLDVKVSHGLTKQRLHPFVLLGPNLQQYFLPETGERSSFTFE